MASLRRIVLVLSILLSVSLGSGNAYGPPADVHKTESAFTAGTASMDIPYWAIVTPADSFVGISRTCHSIEAARQQALDSAVSQILQAMGAEYRLSHESRLSGDLDHARHDIEERLSYNARWLLHSIQQGIKEYAFRNTNDGHICFVLVHMSPRDLARLKRLTIGARVLVRLISRTENQTFIEIRETNGIGVTLTGYRMTMDTRYRHAKLITLFFWKVPESESAEYEGALPRPLHLNGSSAPTAIPLPINRGLLKTALLGSEKHLSITITGYDEIGRFVAASLEIK